MSSTINVLSNHRSIRKFTEAPVGDDLLCKIIAAGQAAASSSFLQGVTIMRVTDPNKRAAFKEITGGQAYVETAPEFLVFCADLSRPMRCCATHGGTPYEGLTEHFIIATVDVALCAQNVAVAAESVGLGICYIGAIRNDAARSAELLDLPQQVYPVFGMCIGWPDQDPEVKPRLPLTVMLKEDSYGIDGEAEAIAIYDEEMRNYYATRSANIKIQGWSEQMAGLLGKESRLHMRPFLEGKGFLKR
ncbi:MAG: oxygen-insensitive NADPH nitroreductase [Rhodospirillaceae bacterium]|nr:oxygen-insensitive NADPH nitroreductase [Rhodospirillaceae bacterium]